MADGRGKEKLKNVLSKIGGFVKEKGGPILEGILEVADDIYPPLSIVTNIVKKISPNLSDEEQVEVEQLLKSYHQELELHLENTKDARLMYRTTDHQTSDSIADNIITWNLWIMLGLVVVQVCVILFVEGPVAAVVTGIVGTLTGALINERNTVINFFFGSSQGSKDKSKKFEKK